MNKPLLYFLFLVLGIVLLPLQKVKATGTPISLYKTFSGNYDYKIIGNTESSNELCPSEIQPTSSNLNLPAGASVAAAYLYWSGSGAADNKVTLNGQTVNASRTFSIPLIDNYYNMTFFGAFANVTSQVSGSGNYSVDNLSWTKSGQYCQGYSAYGGWALLVVYQTSSLPACNINIYDGFKGYWPAGTVAHTLSHLNIPTSCSPEVELTHITWEGDSYKGEHFYINNNYIGNNTLNGSTSPNLDIDYYNISNYVNAGDNSIALKTTSYLTNNAIEWYINNVYVVKSNTCSPCAGQGGDGDGDGVCANQDCNDNNPNVPANPGTACNDGNPNTTGDVIQNDGCTCAGTPIDPCANAGGDSDGDGICNNQDNCPNTANPNQADSDGDGIGDVCDTPSADCNSISITAGNGSITVSGLDGAPISSLQIFNANWQQQYSCFADCGATQTVNLAAGTYLVYAKYYSSAYALICQREESITVTGGGNPCDNNGGDADGDGICNNQDNCPNTYNPDQADSDGDGIGDVCDTPGADCSNISITGGNGTLTVSGLDGAPVSSLQVFNANWQQEFNCFANCGATETINLAAGTYLVYAKYYTSAYVLICQREETVTVAGGGNPCDNNGGDSDGDGICNNQDNCPNTYNPGQADSDGDGIGDACDTPDNTCTPVQLVYWDLNGCTSYLNNGTNQDYSEFNPVISSFGGCANVDATNAYRNNPSVNTHSCTEGLNNSEAMCIGAQSGCSFTNNSNAALRFQVTLSPTSGQSSSLTGINFFEKAPAHYSWIDGNSGLNNYPTKYGIRVTKNGQEVFKQTGIATTGSYSLESFDFSNDPDFTVNTSTTFSFELLAYCVVGNGASVMAWDIEDIKVMGCCANNDPCANNGGDSDGDGICNNQDNCPNTYNPGQADSDGDGIGDACDTPTTDCNNITISAGNGSITVSGLDGAPVSSLQIFNANWQQEYSCFANCGASQTVNLPNGTYQVYAKYYTSAYQAICQVEQTISVGGGNPCDNVTNGGQIAGNESRQGGYDPALITNVVAPSGGSGALEYIWLSSTSGCPTNINQSIPGATGLTYDPGFISTTTYFVRCSRRAGCTDPGTWVESNCITKTVTAGDPCANNGGDSDGDGVCNNQDNCPNVYNPGQTDSDGDGIGDDCDTPDNTCSNISISTGNGSITVSGLDGAAISSLQIFNASWQQQFNCFANCSATETINLPNGTYLVFAKYYTSAYLPICQVEETVTVTGSDPCANNGGDSDGDGVCNNQDNCPNTYNPNQADSDGDGIGNVCDQSYNCSPVTLAKWDLEACYSNSGNNSGSDYSEFTASYPNSGTCLDVSASFIYRNQGNHSCTPGYNGNTAMCVGTETGCSFIDNDPYALRFEVTLNPGDAGRLSGLTFYEKAPTHYNWIGGASGTNNYPKKYGVRVLKNGQEVFKQTGISTTQSWSLESFDFSNDPDFEITTTTTFSFELRAYCRVGNGASQSVWDVDDFKITGCCSGVAPRQIDLFAFDAIKAQQSVDLAWTITTDYKTDRYLIERSVDGINFEVIEESDSKYHSIQAVVYETKDKQPAMGINYYRIKQLFDDGSFRYSETKQVLFEVDPDRLVVFPNPTSDRIQVGLKEYAGMPAVIQIHNSLGVLLQERTLEALTVDPIAFEVGEYNSGVYTVTLRVDGRKQLTKLFVISKL